MPEFAYQDIEAWHTGVKLAASTGRLKIGSNLKASADAQAHAFEQAGLAVALIAEGSTREGPGQAGLYRDARGALAQCRAWLHVLAAVTNENESVFLNEFELAEQASRQVSALIRNLERGGPAGAGARPPMRPAPGGPGPRPAGPPRGGAPR
ncbi:MAG: hypothetical protein HY875_07000 [Chloroflexi bacterium]|nr:hypothetical protein [Chloroflexota bacterium]